MTKLKLFVKLPQYLLKMILNFEDLKWVIILKAI